MTSSRSFIDLLFILLCSTIVMLTQSIRVGAVHTAPARVGAGGVSAIAASDVVPVVVQDEALLVEGQPTSVAALAPKQAYFPRLAGSGTRPGIAA